jgi:hypothetical protein
MSPGGPIRGELRTLMGFTRLVVPLAVIRQGSARASSRNSTRSRRSPWRHRRHLDHGAVQVVGVHGTSAKHNPSSIMANRPDVSVRRRHKCRRSSRRGPAVCRVARFPPTVLASAASSSPRRGAAMRRPSSRDDTRPFTAVEPFRTRCSARTYQSIAHFSPQTRLWPRKWVQDRAPAAPWISVPPRSGSASRARLRAPQDPAKWRTS